MAEIALGNILYFLWKKGINYTDKPKYRDPIIVRKKYVQIGNVVITFRKRNIYSIEMKNSTSFSQAKIATQFTSFFPTWDKVWVDYLSFYYNVRGGKNLRLDVKRLTIDDLKRIEKFLDSVDIQLIGRQKYFSKTNNLVYKMLTGEKSLKEVKKEMEKYTDTYHSILKAAEKRMEQYDKIRDLLKSNEYDGCIFETIYNDKQYVVGMCETGYYNNTLVIGQNEMWMFTSYRNTIYAAAKRKGFTPAMINNMNDTHKITFERLYESIRSNMRSHWYSPKKLANLKLATVIRAGEKGFRPAIDFLQKYGKEFLLMKLEVKMDG